MEEIGRVDESTWFFRTFVKKRVKMGYVFAILFLVLAEPSYLTMSQGLVIALVGAAIRTWASGVIVKNNELAKTGPYAIVRNPLYVGSFIMGFGVAFMAGSRTLITFFVIFFVFVYGALVRSEEKFLLSRYGDDFLKYCRQVPRFIPEPWKIKSAPALYDVNRMLFKHKEWKAWLGLLGAGGFLMFVAHRYWTHTSLLILFFKKLFAAPPVAG